MEADIFSAHCVVDDLRALRMLVGNAVYMVIVNAVHPCNHDADDPSTCDSGKNIGTAVSPVESRRTVLEQSAGVHS